MVAPIKITISIQKTLFDQAQILAQQLNIPQSHLFEMAIENYINSFQGQSLPDKFNQSQEDQLGSNQQTTLPYQPGKSGEEPIVVNQGDIYWIHLEEPNGSELGYYPHPYVVIQDDALNHSRINTVVVCALTSNMRQANEPGNVRLNVGEASLPKQSAVVVSKISTVDKSQLGEYIGSLTKQRINNILAGIRFQQRSFYRR